MREPDYLLDSDVLIRASREYYAFDLAPAFWETLARHADSGTVGSIDQVCDELKRGKDDLAEWARTRFSRAFRSTDEADVIAAYRGVMAWVTAQPQYLPAAVSGFAGAADGWLVAFAAARGCTIVTNELSSRDSKRKVKLPDVCEAFGVQYMDTFAMLRKLAIRLA